MNRLLFAALSLLLFTTPVAVLAQRSSTTIAIAASGPTLSASVSGQAGRSPFFLLLDKQGTLVEAVANPYKDAGNAGIPALDFLAGKGVVVVEAESFGSRIVDVMKTKGMRPVEYKGTAKEGIRKALESR